MLSLISFSGLWLKTKVKSLLEDEKGEVNIVAIVVLIGIAILLAIIFKSKITELLDSLFKTITKTSTGAVGGE